MTAQSNWHVTRRLLALTWRYRAGCVKVFVYQLVLLVMGLSALGLTGLGIDFIRHELQPTAPAARWPFHLMPPSDWSPMAVIAAIAGVMLLLAVVRACLNYVYSIGVAELIERHIVVELRSQVYDKLQRLSFQFFDANASGSIINRVTGDSRAVANFVNNALLQGIIMFLSLAVYVAYMLAIHVKLTLA